MVKMIKRHAPIRSRYRNWPIFLLVRFSEIACHVIYRLNLHTAEPGEGIDGEVFTLDDIIVNSKQHKDTGMELAIMKGGGHFILK